jgi:signal transduction histidine kinase/DNA-binding response OmpR family regulator
LASLIDTRDWSYTPLGPAETWPQSLRTVLGIMLTSRYAMWMGWGPELTFFYNDAYAAMSLGAKHPWALGRPASEVWAEIWPDISPRIETVLRTGHATWDEGLLLFLERSGFREETYHTFSYSPLPDDSGTIGGMLCVVTEETERFIGERRLATLRELAAELASARTEADVARAICKGLEHNLHDLPFTLTYLFDDAPGPARLACCTGFPSEGHPAAPKSAPLDGRLWEPTLARIRAGAPYVVLNDLSGFPALPCGAWDMPPRRAVAVPIAHQGQDGVAGVFIAGINPYRPFAEPYSGFKGLIAAQIAAGLAGARSYEAERRRAEALAEIDRAKTAFFSNVSHEFRTPLTLMLGPLEEEMAARGGRSAERLAMAHRNGLRLLRLVNTLLDVARIEAGRVRASFRPTDLAAYTAELASNFRSACERADLTLAVNCPPLPQPVYVDAEMWERVVLNLVSNAFKYTLRGGIRISVTPADGAAELVVEDSGVGIPEAEIPRIFDRFHRIEGQAGRTLEGTGIGLALVNELVRLHGGSIVVQSRINVGTVVRVTLPFGSAHLPAEQVCETRGRVAPEGVVTAAFVEEALRWLPQDAPAGGPAVGGVWGTDTAIATDEAARGAGRPRLLLADDNADMRDYVSRLLGAEYSVLAVADGEAALRAVQMSRPDLVLTDVMMPRLDGFGLLAGIRGDPALRDLPVILVSARAGDEARVEGLDAGADDYLVKPFSALELLARVRTNLALARIRSQAAEQIREEAHRLELLNRTGKLIAAELDPDRLVETVLDAARELTGAQSGAFFESSGGGTPLLTRTVGSPFPLPPDCGVLAGALSGAGVLRSAEPRHGIASCLAVPLVCRSGNVIGALAFCHREPDRFSTRDELIVAGIAAQAAIGLDNGRLYQASRQAEEALRRLNETLETRVEEEIRERLRTEEALRQSQKMEAIGQLTGGVAHDFNNLLTVISGGAETLQRLLPADSLGENAARVNRSVAMIAQGAGRAATLTHRLLAFSRRQTLDPRPVEANKLIAGMSELMRRTLGEHVAIETVLAGGLWRTLADQNQLENAVLNLAVNARDAMPGGGKLTIETANAYLDEAYAARNQEVAAGQYVLVAVSDTGTGMNKDTLDRVFEPFFTTKEAGRGTGLGLSQVYGFIKQSRGHVKIYSELGQGTVVKLYLPRLLAADATAPEADAPDEATPRTEGSELILVVEDDEDVRRLTTDTLRELGYRVLEAANGAAALETLARSPGIRLLFTDVGLPGGMTGRQLAEQVRRLRPDLRVLFTTGYARNAIVHGGILDPGTQLLLKPFTFAGLAAKVRSALQA